MNVYSELLELLTPRQNARPGGIFGKLSGLHPLTVTVGEETLSEGLFYPRGTRFYQEDLGRELVLLPCDEGFLILCFTEGGGT